MIGNLEKGEGMDKKSKILLWVIIMAILVSVGVTFYKTVLLQDFEVVNTEEEASSDGVLEEGIVGE